MVFGSLVATIVLAITGARICSVAVPLTVSVCAPTSPAGRVCAVAVATFLTVASSAAWSSTSASKVTTTFWPGVMVDTSTATVLSPVLLPVTMEASAASLPESSTEPSTKLMLLPKPAIRSLIAALKASVLSAPEALLSVRV